ncbi:hypothetical protein CXG81DRAFT_25806 [Caulochytrium protostelioides]|uniref:MHD domain-containing protein n=1 Tax=Caulochytrium protostelioides TaxID=1555241 RepID=A0A4P9X8G4_9FUNG|nr:hypothetical protein CXG81DRAFT_25806 [Caulochytrium protostelioides]|eukprot:RKP01532.1 hypothetical protein CXG81DRAFT_25806 [Caulochytrium protostelioides]
MLDTLFILDPSDEVLLEKHWSGRATRQPVDAFWALARHARVPDAVPAVMVSEPYYVHAVAHDGLWWLGVNRVEAPPASVLALLRHLIALLADYVGAVSASALRTHVVVVCELLEEVVDAGVPALTEPALLREIVPPPSRLAQVIDAVALTRLADRTPAGHFSAIPWRQPHLRYAQNALWLDMVETVHLVADARMRLLAGQVCGALWMKAQLSGMPDITARFADPHRLVPSLAAVHPCVRYARFEHDHALSFIPPDGRFKLMDYVLDLSDADALPFVLKHRYTLSGKTGRLDLTLLPRLPPAAGSAAVARFDHVVVSMAMPDAVTSMRMSCSEPDSTSHFDPQTHRMTWRLGAIEPTQRSLAFSSTLYLTDAVPDPAPGRARAPSGPPPPTTVTIAFHISQWLLSGLKLRALQILRESYQPYQSLRAVTQSGRCEIRLPSPLLT